MVKHLLLSELARAREDSGGSSSRFSRHTSRFATVLPTIRLVEAPKLFQPILQCNLSNVVMVKRNVSYRRIGQFHITLPFH